MSVIIKTSYYYVLAVTLYLSISVEYEYIDAATLDDIDIDYLNSDYINMSNFEVSVNFKKKSDNTLNLKVQLIKDFPDDIYIKGKASTRVFGLEIPAPFSFYAALCGTFEGGLLYDVFFTPMGVKECPPKKGLYEKRDLYLNYSKVPPHAGLMSGKRIQVITDLMSKDGNTEYFKFRTFIVI